LLCLITAAASVAWTQRSSSPQESKTKHGAAGTLRLGMTREEATDTVGSLQHGMLASRKTATNDYKLECYFTADRTLSQFHPTDRLMSVKFEVDHPSPAIDILRDLPEGRELCRRGCKLIAVANYDGYSYGPHVVVYMTNARAEELDLAARSRINWRPPATEGNWTPALILSWDTESSDPKHPPKPINWLNHPVQRVWLASIEPQTELAGTNQKPAIELGTWQTQQPSVTTYGLAPEVRSIESQLGSSNPPAALRSSENPSPDLASTERQSSNPAAPVSGNLSWHGERVYDDVKAPRLLYQTEPEYTRAARKDKVSGNVSLQIIVGPDGLVKEAEVVKSLRPDLDANAIQAVKRWRFEPAQKDGKAVAVRLNVEMQFQLY